MTATLLGKMRSAFNQRAEVAQSAIVFTIPLALALFFVPSLETPFSTAKTVVLVMAAAVCATARLISGRMKLSDERLRGVSRWYAVCLICFAASVAVAAAMSPWHYLAFPKMVMVAAGLVLFWGFAGIVKGRESWFVAGVACSAAVVAIIALAQFAFEIDLLRVFGRPALVEGRMLVYATMGNPNFVAAWLAASAPTVLACVIPAKKRSVAFRTVVLAAVVAATFATGSRAGVLALGSGLALYVVLHGGRRKIAALALLAAGLVAAAWMPMSVNGREIGTAFRGRAALWRISLVDSGMRKGFGWGPNTFAYLYPARVGTAMSAGVPYAEAFGAPERHAHNDFVEYRSECGWIGLLALVAVLGSWFVVALKHLRLETGDRAFVSASVAGVTAIVVCACFDFPLHRADTWGLLWLWVALPLAGTVASGDTKKIRVQYECWVVAALLMACAGVYSYRSLSASWWTAEGTRDEGAGFLVLAERDYRRAIALDKASQSAHFNLARVIARQERYAEADAQARRALFYVNEPEVWLLLSRIEQRRGERDEARKYVEMAIRAFPYSEALRAEEKKLIDESLASAAGVR